jgi:hypothetical protein
MQAWDYRKVAFYRQPSEQTYSVHVDEKKLSSTPMSKGAPSMLSLAKEQGAEGWELVTVTDVTYGVDEVTTLWFKRPK